ALWLGRGEPPRSARPQKVLKCTFSTEDVQGIIAPEFRRRPMPMSRAGDQVGANEMDGFMESLRDREWLGKALGIEFSELTAGRVVASMTITPTHHQPFGYLHGGASVALAETVASFGGWLNCPPGKGVVGLEINANHLRPRRSGTLTAIGAPLHSGHTNNDGA